MSDYNHFFNSHVDELKKLSALQLLKPSKSFLTNIRYATERQRPLLEEGKEDEDAAHFSHFRPSRLPSMLLVWGSVGVNRGTHLALSVDPPISCAPLFDI